MHYEAYVEQFNKFLVIIIDLQKLAYLQRFTRFFLFLIILNRVELYLNNILFYWK